MANSPSLIDRSTSLAALLATAVSDGTYEDVLETTKVDLAGHEAPASEVADGGGQLWSNIVDDAVKRTIQSFYKGVKLWSAADSTERDALGSDDDLAADDLLFQRDTGALYTCASVDGASASTWTATLGGLAAILAAGNTTSGTDIKISNDDAIVGEDGGSITFETGTGLIETSIMCAGDPGAESGGITVSGATYQSALKVSDLGGSNAAQFILHRHSTTLAPVMLAARSHSADADHAVVEDGDGLLYIFAAGHDGTDYALGGGIIFAVEGTPGSDDMPTSFRVELSPDGSQTPTPRLKISPDGATEITGTLAVSGHNYSTVKGSTARGSTNTLVYRWTSETASAGSSIVYADSAADGGSWTVGEAGIYTVTLSQLAGHDGYIAIKAAASLSNTFDEASILASTATKSDQVSLAWTGPLAADAKIWIAIDVTTDPGGSTNQAIVTVTKIY